MLSPQHNIGQEHGAGNDMLAQHEKLIAEQGKPANRPATGQHGQQGRKDPTDAAIIEVQQIELPLLQAAQQDGGDQKAGNDKKNVDADKAAEKFLRIGVVAHHTEHRHRADAVNVRPIRQVGNRRRARCRVGVCHRLYCAVRFRRRRRQYAMTVDDGRG